MANRTSAALGEIIRQQRELAEMSMRQFAQLAGISNPYLSQIERGLRAPSQQVLDGVPEKVLDKIRSEVPLDRLGRPDEVARVVHFLSSDASSYITGQVWAVNGGQEM